MSHDDPTKDRETDRVFWDADWPLPVWIFGAFVALMLMLIAYVAQRLATP